MTPRSIRRAQERAALKQARKAERHLTTSPALPVMQAQPVSQAQLDANRQNAQLSTGPKTIEGKATVSLNAVKTGLTGRTVLLPGDDLEAYHAAADRIRRTYNPVGEQEEELVQSIIDTTWRLNRIPELESAIYALGMRQLANEFADVADDTTRLALLRAEAHLRHSRQLNNLGIQESRLLRRRDKDIAVLLELQSKRREVQPVAGQAQEIGFEFSTALWRPVADKTLPTASTATLYRSHERSDWSWPVSTRW